MIQEQIVVHYFCLLLGLFGGSELGNRAVRIFGATLTPFSLFILLQKLHNTVFTAKTCSICYK